MNTKKNGRQEENAWKKKSESFYGYSFKKKKGQFHSLKKETRRDARSRQMAVTTDVSMKVVVDLQI